MEKKKQEMVIYKKMKIPLKAQIFDSSIVISDNDLI